MTRETMMKLKRGDTVYVACKVDAVFVNGGLIQVSTRDCDDGFDAYADEVLEQEPCEDAVSREQAISAIRNLYPGIPFVKTELKLKKWQEENKKYFECENIIKALPSVTPTTCIAKVTFDKDELQKIVDEKVKELPVTQKWIPVSERLPENIGFYLVSTTDCTTIMEFVNGWISQNIGLCNGYVKAWMPLPEPYKAEMESEE